MVWTCDEKKRNKSRNVIMRMSVEGRKGSKRNIKKEIMGYE